MFLARLSRLLLLVALVGCAHRQPGGVVGLADLGQLDIRGPEGAWAPGPDAALLPLGRWIEVQGQIAFTYVDAEQGPSAGWVDEKGFHVRRVSQEPAGARILDDAARVSAGLPEAPPWLGAYGPQPTPGTRWGAWRADPRFAGRFHPEYPDDLRVVVGAQTPDGFAFEVVWLSLRDCNTTSCRGALLNQPDRVPLTRGQQLSFELEYLNGGGLPPAVPPGQVVPEQLVALAASDTLAGMKQDATAWEVDYELPASERLIPMSQWVVVGQDLGFVALGPFGPEALMLTDGAVRRQSLLWRPRAMRALTADELGKLGLPASPLQDPAGQPAPGPWGEWRLDPRLMPLLDPADPDVLLVHLAAPGAARDAVAPLVRVMIRSCTKETCQAVLLADAPGTGLGKGDTVGFGLDMVVGGAPVVVLPPPAR